MLASATGHARLSTPETVKSALHGMEDILSSIIFHIVMSVLHPVLVSSSSPVFIIQGLIKVYLCPFVNLCCVYFYFFKGVNGCCHKR